MTGKWPIVSLGEVASLVGGGTPSKANPDYWSGSIPWASVRDLKNRWLSATEFAITNEGVRSSATNVIPTGNVVIATRVGLGKVVQVDQPTAINQDLRAIVPNNEATLDPAFIYYWYQTVASNVIAAGTGATVQGVKIPTIASLQIPLPPLDEQKSIVAKLDEAMEFLERIQADLIKLAEAESSLASCIIEEVCGSGFRQTKLADLCEVITDGDHQPPPKSESGIPFITISSIDKKNHAIDFESSFRVSQEYFDAIGASRKPKQGDVLYTVTGSYGIPVMVGDDKDFCFQRHIALIRPKPDLYPKWLYYILQGRDLQAQANDQATGTAQKTVTLKSLRGFKVPIVPFEKQVQMVTRIEELLALASRRLVRRVEKEEQIKELELKILAAAFAGEL